MITTLPTPSAASSAAKVLRYGTQKPAGYASFANERGYRKHVIVGKITSLVRGGADLACPPEDFALRLEVVEKFAGATVSPGGTDKGIVEARRARAPPMVFA